jgi:P27 family predicted phage terminase small subunit
MPKFQREKRNRKMRKGRPSDPPHLRLIKGAVRSNRPNRKQTPLDRSGAMPTPPDFLSAEALAEWHDKCPLLFRSGVVTQTNRALLAAYAQSYGRWRQAEEVLARMAKEDETDRAGLLVRNTASGKTVENLMIGIAAKAMSDTVRYAGELGLSPRSRGYPELPPPDDDPATKYLA